MSLTKRYGYAVTLGCDSSGGSSFTVLGNIVDSIEGADVKADEIEVTLLADKIKTWAQGQIDGGQVTFKIAYDPADTSGTTIATLLGNGNVANWQISYPIINAESQQHDTFLAWVAGYKRTIARGSLITAEVTLRLTGATTIAGLGVS